MSTFYAWKANTNIKTMLLNCIGIGYIDIFVVKCLVILYIGPHSSKVVKQPNLNLVIGMMNWVLVHLSPTWSNKIHMFV